MTTAAEVLHRLRDDVEAADVRIRPYVRETPLDRAPALSQAWGAEVYLKLENTQITGSFKLRGAVNRILTTPMSQRVLGVVAASTGNHGVAVAHAAQVLRVPGTVFVPDGAPAHKLAAIRARGAEVVVHGRDSLDAEREARRYAQERGLVYLSPYNDPQVIAGQGTIAAELVRQIERTDVVVVAVGGGGLVSGIAGYLKGTRRDVTVIGCSPSASRVMYESVRAGRILDLPSEPTFSDGTAGGIEPDAITFPLCRTLVDEWVLVSEEEIAAAVRLALDHEHQLVEGAAGVALATAGKLASRFPGGNLVIVVCGGNIGVDTLRRILG